MLEQILRTARVVIVDDVPANLRLMESSLRAFGLGRVQAFSDSAAGLQHLQEEDWDLLLLDLDMPEPNGFDILQALSQRDRAASPVIIVTALDAVEERRRGLTLGANDYLCKPLDLPELMLRVRNNLQLSQASQSLRAERDQLEQRVQARTAELQESYGAVVRALARAAQYKDKETGSHIMRIGESAAMIAEALGQPAEWVELIRLTAPMHDVGKIGIPDQILNKPRAFTPAEREVMCQHAEIGYRILHDQGYSPLTELAADIAYCHHERWDGAGYPRGLAGEDIPLAARIVALCDVYDALRMMRPYKAAWSVDKAQAFIREGAGSHFDPDLVQVMCGLFERIDQLQETFCEADVESQLCVDS